MRKGGHRSLHIVGIHHFINLINLVCLLVDNNYNIDQNVDTHLCPRYFVLTIHTTLSIRHCEFT